MGLSVTYVSITLTLVTFGLNKRLITNSELIIWYRVFLNPTFKSSYDVGERLSTYVKWERLRYRIC